MIYDYTHDNEGECLEIEIEETEAEIHIQMKNKYGYDIGTSARAVKLALYLADYMGIDTDNGMVRMNLSYGIWGNKGL